ncbi:MAG: hypothetical protein Q8936_18055 [Bacillota bacterium]|nr:hypothetical protein [Bacillota bacterium]
MKEKMSDKNLEMMKKIIEAKKQKGSKGAQAMRPDKNMGKTQKAFRNTKKGGVFD